MEQDYKKDYSLLRPFDLEAAKRGEEIIDTDGDECKYIAGPHKETAEIVVEFPCDLGFMTCMDKDLRMAPQAWVEGKPVYKGDVLYAGNMLRTAADVFTDEDGNSFLSFHDDFNVWISGPHGGFGTPLAWEEPRKALAVIEGCEVFKGDRLWHTKKKTWFVAEGVSRRKRSVQPMMDGRLENDPGEDGNGKWWPAPSNQTWTPPKVKREIKLLAYLDADQLFWLRETAQPKWPAVRVPGEDKSIEVEEPADQGGCAE